MLSLLLLLASPQVDHAARLNEYLRTARPTIVAEKPPIWAIQDGAWVLENKVVGIHVRTGLGSPTLGRAMAILGARTNIVRKLETMVFERADDTYEVSAAVMSRTRVVRIWSDGDGKYAAMVVLDDPEKNFVGVFENDPKMREWAKKNVHRLFTDQRRIDREVAKECRR